jgi:hypothetical protein
LFTSNEFAVAAILFMCVTFKSFWFLQLYTNKLYFIKPFFGVVMKKSISFISICLFVFLAFESLNAQTFKLGLFSGYGSSAFENFDDNAGTIPAGVQALISLDKLQFGSIDLGAEFGYSVVPFTFEVQEQVNQQIYKYDWKIKQMVIAALVKVKFLKKSTAHPFIRIGAGLYSGGSTYEFPDEIKQLAQQNNITLNEELNIDSAFGFNIGAGTDIQIGKTAAIFAEFVYHIVSRKPEGATESNGANNWAAQVGVLFGLGK